MNLTVFYVHVHICQLNNLVTSMRSFIKVIEKKHSIGTDDASLQAQSVAHANYSPEQVSEYIFIIQLKSQHRCMYLTVFYVHLHLWQLKNLVTSLQGLIKVIEEKDSIGTDSRKRSIDMSKGKAHVVDGEQERAGAEEQQPPTEGEMFATTKSILMHEVFDFFGDKF